MFAVEFCHVSKSYGKNEKQILTDVDFGIEAGSFFGILAPHQAGKTTLLRLVFDYIRPDKGNIFIFERDSVKHSSKIRRYAGFVPAQLKGDSPLRVKAILKQLHAPFGKMDEERMQELCLKFDLDPQARFRSLTNCQRKCLTIVAVLLNDPPLIILDEPSLDLDLTMRVQTFAELHKLHQNGSTIVFSTISAEEIAVHSTHTAVLQNGTLLDSAPTAEFSALHAHRVRLESSQTAEILDALGFDSFQTHSRVVSFLYTESIDKLIKTLAAYSVKDLTIEQPTMESILKAANLAKQEKRSKSTSKDIPLAEIAQRGNLFEDDWDAESAPGTIINFEDDYEPTAMPVKDEPADKPAEIPAENDSADKPAENVPADESTEAPVSAPDMPLTDGEKSESASSPTSEPEAAAETDLKSAPSSDTIVMIPEKKDTAAENAGKEN